LGSTEWTNVGTGSPVALTVKANRWATLAVTVVALVKAGARRPDVTGGVVGAVVGGTVSTVGLATGVATGTGTGITGTGTGITTGTAATVRLRVWLALPATLTPLSTTAYGPTSAAVGVPEMVAVPLPLSVKVNPVGSPLAPIDGDG
jgi:hypothetical protein